MKLSAQLPQVATQAKPAVRAQSSEATEAKPETGDKVDTLLSKLEKRSKAPMTFGRVLANVAYSAATGAVVGHYINSDQSRSVAYNAAIGAAAFGTIGGLGLGFLGMFNGEGTKGLVIGGVGGAAVGGAVGAASGYIGAALNSFAQNTLHVSPAVAGAVIGGGSALIGGCLKMARQ